MVYAVVDHPYEPRLVDQQVIALHQLVCYDLVDHLMKNLSVRLNLNSIKKENISNVRYYFNINSTFS